MTTDQTAPESTDPAPVADTTTDTTAPEAEPKSGNAEAAKYRTQLRSTETQRDALAAVVQTYQRREVETLAETAGLSSGSDLFTAGTDLADLLDDDGNLDPEKVNAATAAVLETHPNWAKGNPDFGGGDRGTDVTAKGNELTWSAAFKDAR